MASVAYRVAWVALEYLFQMNSDCCCLGSLPVCSCCRPGGCTGCTPQTRRCWAFVLRGPGEVEGRTRAALTSLRRVGQRSIYSGSLAPDAKPVSRDPSASAVRGSPRLDGDTRTPVLERRNRGSSADDPCRTFQNRRTTLRSPAAQTPTKPRAEPGKNLALCWL